MRNKNLILYILLCITYTSQALDADSLTAIDSKIGYITPKLDPYNLSHKPEWSWPQTRKGYKGQTEYDRAGVLPFSWHNDTAYVLLGYETYKEVWTDFTGSANTNDTTPLHTAAREFAEESNIVFYKTAKGKKLTDNYDHNDIQQAVKNLLEPKQNVSQGPIVRGVARGLKPFKQWMYFVEVTYIPANELNKSRCGPGCEMSEFRWISIVDLLRILSTAQKSDPTVKPFITSSKPLYKYFLDTLLRDNVLLFLKNLYEKQMELAKKQPLIQTPTWAPNLIEALELLQDNLHQLQRTL